MPHIVIDYAADMEPSLAAADMVKAVHEAAGACGLFPLADVKTRAQAYGHYQVGEVLRPFLHATAYLLSGRTEEQKSMLAGVLIDALKPYIKSGQLTVDIRDMDRASYRKQVIST